MKCFLYIFNSLPKILYPSQLVPKSTQILSKKCDLSNNKKIKFSRTNIISYINGFQFLVEGTMWADARTWRKHLGDLIKPGTSKSTSSTSAKLLPSWWVCTNCREMPTQQDRSCCKQRPDECFSNLAVRDWLFHTVNGMCMYNNIHMYCQSSPVLLHDILICVPPPKKKGNKVNV